MVVGEGFKDMRLVGECRTTKIKLFGEVIQRIERRIGNAFVGQRPETLGGLKFRCVGRKKTETNTFGDNNLRAGMPACAIENEDNGLVRPRAGVAGKGIEDLLEQGNVDAIRYPPLDTACCGLHEAVEIEPFVFVSADGGGPLSALGPYPA